MLQLAKCLCRNTALLWTGILVQEGIWIPWWVRHESVQSLKAQLPCTLSHLDCQAERTASLGWAELQNSTARQWFYIMLKARVDMLWDVDQADWALWPVPTPWHGLTEWCILFWVQQSTKVFLRCPHSPHLYLMISFEWSFFKHFWLKALKCRTWCHTDPKWP